jgi:hypothetical protein
MAIVLEVCTTVEQRSVVRLLWAKAFLNSILFFCQFPDDEDSVHCGSILAKPLLFFTNANSFDYFCG